MGPANPQVDLAVLVRDARPLHPEVEGGIRAQQNVQIIVHRIVGHVSPQDRCRWDSIARARNEAKLRGNAPWLMFLDEDVVLHPQCIATLVDTLSRRPIYAALAADYLGEYRAGQIAHHVSMGATLFRRKVLEKLEFTWRGKQCECQCCCDDLRRLRWGIDYCPSARAQHMPKGEIRGHSAAIAAVGSAPQVDSLNSYERPWPTHPPSVCLVLCYFGPLPGWIKHYLVSCSYNPSINFLVVTDQENFPAVPPNVCVKRLSRSSFNTLATNTTGVEVCLSHPRKLCDFKPAYGHLFEEFLDGWDYWGYTDLDVIYGDIRRFLSAAKLHEYDVFTARKEYLVGHFTLLRNTPRMRTLYQQSTNFRAVLQSPQVMSFCECGRQWLRRKRGEPLTGDATCDSMTHIVHRLMAKQRISACFSPAVIEGSELATSGWRLRWDAGRLWILNQRREVMYFHFHGYKQRAGYCKPRAIEGDSVFEMSPVGIERVSDGDYALNPIRGAGP